MGVKLTVNGKKEEIETDMTVGRLLESRKIRPEVVTVELNDGIIERGKYPVTQLKDGDVLEFIYFMGGGVTRG